MYRSDNRQTRTIAARRSGQRAGRLRRGQCTGCGSCGAIPSCCAPPATFPLPEPWGALRAPQRTRGARRTASGPLQSGLLAAPVGLRPRPPILWSRGAAWGRLGPNARPIRRPAGLMAARPVSARPHPPASLPPLATAGLVPAVLAWPAARSFRRRFIRARSRGAHSTILQPFRTWFCWLPFQRKKNHARKNPAARQRTAIRRSRGK